MRHLWKVNAAVAIIAVALVSFGSFHPVAAADKFVPSCSLPFQAIAKKQEVDETCPPEGKTESEKHRSQNRAKNNLCAAGTPITITYQTFKSLQKKAEDQDIPFGSSNSLPSDRDALRDIHTLSSGQRIGEGSLVRYVAFITHPRYSNKSKGETVNCKVGGAANNDIHIDLARKPMSEEPACRTVTAEIIPHFRPPWWEVENLKQVMNRPVRIIGQLFFDASHRPCKHDEDNASPKRISLWEIHPVYAIDVCKQKTLTSCTAAADSKWVPLHQWLNIEDDEEDGE